MADTKHAAKPTAAPAAKAAPKRKENLNMMIIVGVIVVVVIVAIAALALYKSNTSTSTTPPNGSTLGSGNTTATAPTTTVLTGGGAGMSYMSQAEAASLVGTGGTYNGIGYSGAGFASGTGGNITAAWIVKYQVPGKPNATVNEEILETPEAQSLYARAVSASPTTPNSVNASVNGLIYSSSYATNSTYGNMTVLIGYKNNEIGAVEVSGPEAVNIIALASIVARDMP